MEYRCNYTLWQTLKKNLCINKQINIFQKVQFRASDIKIAYYSQQHFMDERRRFFNFIECSANLLKKLILNKNTSLNHRKRTLKIKVSEINWVIEGRMDKNINHIGLVRSRWLPSVAFTVWSWYLSSLFEFWTWFTHESCWYVRSSNSCPRN